jgi:hypothetical protein
MTVFGWDGTQVAVAFIAAVPLSIAAVTGIVSARRSGRTEKQLQPNGGSSAYDRLTVRLDDQDDALADLHRAVGDIAGTVAALMQEQVRERVRAQMAEADLLARLERGTT